MIIVLQVERLYPAQWIENLLYAAKCNLELKRQDEARNLLRCAAKLPVRNPEDHEASLEVSKLLFKLGDPQDASSIATDKKPAALATTVSGIVG